MPLMPPLKDIWVGARRRVNVYILPELWGGAHISADTASPPGVTVLRNVV